MYIGREWTAEYDRRAKVNNAELRYGIVGEGEPVLCIHGTNVSDAFLTPLQFYPRLFEDYQLIAYCRAGYNGSTLEKESLSIEESAEHGMQLLQHLGIDKAHVMAFSFGGIVGFQMMISYPELVHSAILIEPYLTRESQEAIDANVEAATKAIEIFQTGDALKAGMTYQEAICGPNFFSALEMTSSLDLWERVAESIATTFTVDFPAVMNWGFTPSKADEFAPHKPTMPVLAMMGLESESILPGFRETQRFLMNWLPQAERAAIPNATHGMQFMNPIAVGEAAHAFLKEYPIE